MLTAQVSLVESHRERLQELIRNERAILEKKLTGELCRIKRELPVSVLQITLREFLQLEMLPIVEARGPSIADKTRRVTRSMSAKLRESITVEDSKRMTMRTTDVPIITQTPKFHPGLPETPAAIRAARRRTSKALASNAAPKTSNIFNDPSVPVVRASITRKRTMDMGSVMSVELTDGKVLDVDITQSPSKLLQGLGKDAVQEMRSKMQTYATHLKAFFKRLQLHDK